MIEAIIAHFSAFADLYHLLFGLSCACVAERITREPKS